MESGGDLFASSRGSTTSRSNGQGGSYGGAGAHASPAAAYGVVEEALLLGSGGDEGTRGGGLIHVQAGSVRIDGVVTARGQNGPSVNCLFGNYPGGGSGGSIQIETDLLEGTGTIAADGGHGFCTSGIGGGGGSGGRIVLRYDAAGATFPALHAYGGGGEGNAATASRRGSAGTIYLRPSRLDDGVLGELIIDNNNYASDGDAAVPLYTGLAAFKAIIVREDGRLTATGGSNMGPSLMVEEAIEVSNGGTTIAMTGVALDVTAAGRPDIDVVNSAVFTLGTGSSLSAGMSVGVNGGTFTTRVGLAFAESADLTMAAGTFNADTTSVITIPTFDETHIQGGRFNLRSGSRLDVASNAVVIESGVTFQKDGLFGNSGDEIESLTVRGRMEHATARAEGLYLNVFGDLVVESGGELFASSRGNTTSRSNGQGGSYGGAGAHASPSAAYGVVEEALVLGSGGDEGTRGGGRIHVQAGSVRIDGVVTARGQNGPSVNCATGNYPGGGSGGSVQIETDLLEGTGTIAADGGHGYCTGGIGGGGGSGGRVVLRYDAAGATFPALHAYGGGGQGNDLNTASRRGSAGTIYLRPSRLDDGVLGELIVDNNNYASDADTAAPLYTALSSFLSISARADGRLVVVGGDGIGASLVVEEPIEVQGAGSSIDMTNLALDVPTAGRPDINVTSSGAFTLGDGCSLSEGMSVGVNGGTFTTRVNVTFAESADLTLTAGSFDVRGASVTTIPTFDETHIQGGRFNLFAGSRLDVGADTVVIESGVTFQKDGFLGSSGDEIGSLVVRGRMEHATGRAEGLYLNVVGSLAVESGGDLFASSRGTTTSRSNGQGGSYGGAGAHASPSAAYGVVEEALVLGSGGDEGSRGGGLIHVQAGSVRVDGVVTARGQDGFTGNCLFGNYPGGGSGGSIQIETDLLEGTGTIAADGGHGYCTAGIGGGGGSGGRVVLRYDAAGATFPALHAYGGGGENNASTPSRRGSAGTIYLRPSRLDDGVLGELIVDNNDYASDADAAAPLYTALASFDRIRLEAGGKLDIPSGASFDVNDLSASGSSQVNFEGEIEILADLQVDSDSILRRR